MLLVLLSGEWHEAAGPEPRRGGHHPEGVAPTRAHRVRSPPPHRRAPALPPARPAARLPPAHRPPDEGEVGAGAVVGGGRHGGGGGGRGRRGAAAGEVALARAADGPRDVELLPGGGGAGEGTARARLQHPRLPGEGVRA